MMTLDPDSAWAVLGLVGNHLWQSTVVAAIAGLLILTVRQAGAPVRYWIWLAASAKFLVPFSALVALGSQVSWRSVIARPTANLTLVMDAISQPFGQQTFDVTSARVPPSAEFMTMLPIALLGIWLAGTAVLLARWLITWRRIAAIVGEGTPVEQGRVTETLRRLEWASGVTRRITIVSSTTTLEPGVFGIVRPVLLWSRDLGERLDDQQVEAILAHEVSHVKRHDNLTAALHMVVEAVFWFHPLVWWLSARLVEERERACDEAVVRLGSDPHVYASGILKMCEFYVESPLACVSGVTGADLKRRIEAIMRHPLGANLTAWRKVLLATVAVAIIAGPVVMGLMNAPQIHAQTRTLSPTSLAFEVASVKPDKSTSPRDSGFGMPADRFEGKGLSLHDLIATAYGAAGSPPRWLADYQIAGGPKWMETDRFEVLAKAEAPLPEGTEGERRKLLMLRTLLAERFKLVVHQETRNVPIYELAVARSDGRLGPKLHRVPDDCAGVFAERRSNPGPSSQATDVQPRCLMMMGWGALTVQGQSMDAVADVFSRLAGRLVVNRTALKGAFDLELQFNPEGLPLTPLGAPPSGNSGDAPSIFTAIQEQLGLKLVSSTGPIDVLVVERAEPPTDNQADAGSPSPRDSTQPTRIAGATAQGSAQSRWLADETDHFDVFYLASVGAHLDPLKREVERAYNTVSSERRHDIPYRPALLVFGTRTQMAQPFAVDQLAVSGATMPPPTTRLLIAVDLSPEQRNAELLRQLRALFERDIAATLTPRSQAASPNSTTAFAVASVKANTSGDTRTIAPPLQAGGRYTATNIPLELLIAVAFQPIQRYEVVGIPDWARTARYDIEARADGNPTPATVWLMLQALLAERFGMVAHRETRPMPVYSLIATRRGQMGKQLRLHTDDSGCVDARTAPPPAPRAIRPDEALPQPPCGAFSGAPALGRLAGQRVTLDTLGRALSGQLGRMVVDHSGLTGPFDFTLEWAPPQPAASADANGRSDVPPDTRPSIFTAVEEQLGLKLVPDTGPVSVVVVDRLERPTAN